MQPLFGLREQTATPRRAQGDPDKSYWGLCYTSVINES